MAHEGGHEQADDSRTHHEWEGGPFGKGNGADQVFCQSGVLQGQPQGKAAGYQPEHVPAHFLQVFLGDGFRNGKDGNGNHGDGIGVQPVYSLARYPQQDGNGKGDVNDNGLGGFQEFPSHLQFQFLLGDGEQPQQEKPCNQNHDDDERNAEHEPFAEGDVQPHTLQRLQRDCVGGRADRRSNAAEVGGDGDGQGKGGAAFVFRSEQGQHRRQDGEHHGGRSRVAHKHGEKSRYGHQPQKYEFGIGAEGF